MFDPIVLSKTTEKIVCQDERRKYYRFRPAAFYGGIVTADCVGCNLRCIFCWAWNVVNNPVKIGKFYSPKEVVDKLVSIAKSRGLTQLRISGNEPTLGKKHLLKVLSLIPKNYLFILETNGILIGHDKSYAKELSKFSNLHVRVSLKGSCEEEFSRMTGAKKEAFELQLKALENLTEAEVDCHVALIEIANSDISGLKKRLAAIDKKLEDIEIEPLILYPQVRARLEKAKLYKTIQKFKSSKYY